MMLQSTPPPASLDGRNVYELLVQLEDRVTRIETVLFKLALHVGVQPRTGERLCDAK